MMKRSILAATAACLALSLASAGHAQTASAGAAAPVDPVRMQLARQIVEATGGEKTAEAQMRAVYANMATMIGRTTPPDQSKLAQQMMADVQEEMVKLVPGIVEISTRVQAQTFTEQELRDVLVFYTSPSGQAILHKMPIILQQTMTEEMPLIQTAMPKIMQKTLDRVCEEQKCTPQVRQVMADAMTKAMSRPRS